MHFDRDTEEAGDNIIHINNIISGHHHSGRHPLFHTSLSGLKIVPRADRNRCLQIICIHHATIFGNAIYSWGLCWS